MDAVTYGDDFGCRLFWIDTNTGEAYKVGNFPDGYQVFAFAIPYDPKIHQVSITQDGILNWEPLDGVSEYKIYASDEPYDGYTWIGTTPINFWADPDFPHNKRFYRETSVYYREPVQLRDN
jgi:hypothetical protein